MTIRTLINLTLILLVGIGVLVGKSLWTEYQEKQPNEYLKTLKPFSPETITKITLSQNDQTLIIAKENVDWKIGSKSADSTKIKELLTNLMPETSPLLVAQSPEQLKNLGATQESGVNVEIATSDGKTQQFIIGKQTGAATIVALTAVNQAYSLLNVPTISTNPGTWYNLSIVDIDSADIKQLTFTTKGTSYTIVQNNPNEWSFEGDTTLVDNSKVNNFVMKLNPLKATSLAFEDKQKEYNQGYVETTLVITTKSGQAITLDFYKGTTDYLVKSTPNGEYYTVTSYDGEDMTRTKDKFLSGDK